MSSSPWNFFLDHAIVALLLLLGTMIRAQVGIVQRLFLPANFVAGALGLLLGPNGLGWLPFSQSIADYPGLLIALVFAALPFASSTLSFGDRSLPTVQLWLYSVVAILLQWSLAIFFTFFVLQVLWPGLPDGFASLLAVGFVGGYGTAAAVGATFSESGWNAGQSLAMASATVGLITSVIGGIALIQWGIRSGSTASLAQFTNLSQEVKTGLIPPDKRSSLGNITIASSALNSLTFHLSLLLLSTLAGYFLNQESAVYLQHYRLPVFSLAFVSAGILSRLLQISGASSYIDQTTVQNLQSVFVDFLVVFGISSISLPAVAAHLFPLVLLLGFGTLLCLWFFVYLGPKAFSSFWFENALFTWGWVTGIAGIAVALLQIADPEHRSRVSHHFGVAYVLIAPVEITFVIFAPLLLVQGKGLVLAVATGVAAIVTIVVLTRLCKQAEEGK